MMEVRGGQDLRALHEHGSPAHSSQPSVNYYMPAVIITWRNNHDREVAALRRREWSRSCDSHGRNFLAFALSEIPPTANSEIHSTHSASTTAAMSQQALNKIAANSASRAKPTEIETNIATALYELETNIPDMKSALRPLQFVSAREVR